MSPDISNPIANSLQTNIKSTIELIPTTIPPILSVPLEVTLEDLLAGCTKELTVRRKVPVITGNDTNTIDVLQYEEVSLTVEVGAGWKNGTKITYPAAGDYSVEHKTTGDLIFVLTTSSHDRFQRTHNNADLYYRHRLTLVDALCGSMLTLHVLDGRILTIPLMNVITLDTQFVVEGEGLPRPNKTNSTSNRGNILIHFDIVFPSELNLQQKAQIKQILS
jgi:DnaJ family protein B protein 4